MSDQFTPSSNVGFDDRGAFNVGMEVFFQGLDTPNVVNKSFDVPFGMKTLNIFGGSAAMRPKDPTKDRYWKADGLFLVRIDGINIISVILKTTEQPQCLSIGSFTYITRDNPDPPRQILVEFQEAGAGVPVNMELQLCGQWTR